MRSFLFTVAIVALLMPFSLFGAELQGSVIQVSRALRMSSAEPIPPKDYYLDIGNHTGVKPGDIFTVYRIMAVLNETTGGGSGLLRIPLGDVKVYLVGEFTSISRLVAPISARDLPVMDYPIVMLGDQVELKSSLPFQR